MYSACNLSIHTKNMHVLLEFDVKNAIVLPQIVSCTILQQFEPCSQDVASTIKLLMLDQLLVEK
jgi:hypothetical protein